MMSFRIAIFTNPHAGSGRAMRMSMQIADSLKKRNISFCLVDKQWPSLIHDYTDVWIVGGDGTLNYFINQYPDLRIPLMIFPGGSGNDFSTLLYGKRTLEELIEIGLIAEVRPVDAGICNNRLFINGAGIAFEGSVVELLVGKNKRAGKIDFLLAIFKRVFFYREPLIYLIHDNGEFKGKCLMVSVMNGKTSGGGFMVGPEASVNDGAFEIGIVKDVSPLMRLRYLPVIEKGKHIVLPFVDYFKSSKISIQSEVPIPAHLDGEYLCAKIIEIGILPGKFLFRIQ
jgi:YegS/Rv2252/BmrU family lipid kinase